MGPNVILTGEMRNYFLYTLLLLVNQLSWLPKLTLYLLLL